MSTTTPRKRRYKLRNLEVDRVDLVDTGANQHAFVVISKGKEETEGKTALMAEILRRKKKGMKATGTAFPEKMAAEVSKHAMHNQDDHGNWATGSGGSRSLSGVRIEDRDSNIFSGVDSSGDRVKFRASPEDAKSLRSAMFGDLASNLSGVEVDASDILSEKTGGGGGDNFLADPPSSGKIPYVSPSKFDSGDGDDGGSDNWLGDNAPSGPRSISAIASEIRRDWAKVNYGAVPYLDAMGDLDKITDNYYQDSAESVIAYFLGNATSWRGDTARRVKAELNAMLKQGRVRKAFAKHYGPGDHPDGSSQKAHGQRGGGGGGDSSSTSSQKAPASKPDSAPYSSLTEQAEESGHKQFPPSVGRKSRSLTTARAVHFGLLSKWKQDGDDSNAVVLDIQPGSFNTVAPWEGPQMDPEEGVPGRDDPWSSPRGAVVLGKQIRDVQITRLPAYDALGESYPEQFDWYMEGQDAKGNLKVYEGSRKTFDSAFDAINRQVAKSLYTAAKRGEFKQFDEWAERETIFGSNRNPDIYKAADMAAGITPEMLESAKQSLDLEAIYQEVAAELGDDDTFDEPESDAKDSPAEQEGKAGGEAQAPVASGPPGQTPTTPPPAPQASPPQPGMTTSSLQTLLTEALALVTPGGGEAQSPPPREDLANFMRQRQAADPTPSSAGPPGVGVGPVAPGALPGQPGGRPTPGGVAPVPGPQAQQPQVQQAQPQSQPQPNAPRPMPRTSGELAEMTDRKKWPPKG